MVWEFVIWLAAASVLQVLLQGAGGLSPLVSLLIAAPAAAVAVTLGLIAVNGDFRRRARQVEARIDQRLPPCVAAGFPGLRFLISSAAGGSPAPLPLSRRSSLAAV